MSIAQTISGYNRKRKFKLFRNNFRVDKTTTILDAGYADQEYSNVSNYLERHYPYPENITALGVVEPKEFSARYPKVHVVVYDGRVFPFADKQFDICWSNAVIEHVGDYDRQLLFLKEMKRVAHAVYLTTPNRFFPVEVHTKLPLLHWLPRGAFNRAVTFLGKEWAAGDFMHLLTLGKVKRLLADAGITDYAITKNRILGLAMDFSITARF